jgi:hypothetical protein
MRFGCVCPMARYAITAVQQAIGIGQLAAGAERDQENCSLFQELAIRDGPLASKHATPTSMEAVGLTD